MRLILIAKFEQTWNLWIRAVQQGEGWVQILWMFCFYLLQSAVAVFHMQKSHEESTWTFVRRAKCNRKHCAVWQPLKCFFFFFLNSLNSRSLHVVETVLWGWRCFESSKICLPVNIFLCFKFLFASKWLLKNAAPPHNLVLYSILIDSLNNIPYCCVSGSEPSLSLSLSFLL